MLDDPFSLLMQGIWLLAAGMYPLGFMFGTCSACCNQCRNDTCEGFDLEEAFGGTRTSGRLEYCQEFTPGPELLSLTFSATCFGGGAAGTVEGLGEPVGPGPLVSVSLTNGGSGYARLGRQAPTLALANSSTTPADVTISFSQTQGECNLDFWSVDSITVNNGGAGYTDGDGIAFTAAEGNTVVLAATGTISTLRVQPTIAASTANGTGATFTVSVAEEDVAPDPLTWKISGVTFSGTTSGFVNGEAVTFSGDNLVELVGATATVVTKRVEPQLSAAIPFSFGTGSGAVLAVTLASNNDDPETWSVDDVQITSAGTGYVEFDVVYFSVVSGTEENSAYAYVSQVDANGEILAISIQGGGTYYEIGDELDSIQLDDGGLFYRDNGTIASIAITDGGSYYDEDPSLTPYVQTPTVAVQQIAPSAGSGAQINAVVDDNTASATFGEVVSLTLSDSGNGYLAFELIGNWEYKGDGIFEFAGLDVNALSGFPQAGCRVYGSGIAPGTVVTETEEIQDPPKEPYVLGDKRGCCEIKYQAKNCSTGILGSVITQREVLTEQGCDDQEAALEAVLCPGAGNIPPSPRNIIVSKAWSECESCQTPPQEVGPEVISGGRVGTLVGAKVTVSPAPTEPIGPCISFCGTGGKCGPFNRDPNGEFQFGPYGSGVSAGGWDQYRRNCIRWVCRCYEGTGKKGLLDEETGDPLFPAPADWFTVASTAVVGGPTTNDLNLGEELSASGVEMEWLFDLENWGAADGEIKCVVYAFIFYGESARPTFVDLCELGPTVKTGKNVTSGDGIYEIKPCERCS